MNWSDPRVQEFGAPALAPASILMELRRTAGPEVEIQGQEVHGWFFRTLQRLEPKTAAALHATGRRKPFTLWAGPPFCTTPDGVFAAGDDPDACWLRVTVLDPAVAPLVDRALRLDREIRFGTTIFRILSATADAAAHPWAALASYDALSRDTAGSPPVRVRLRFLTPTAFSGDAAPTLFPVARLVFTSLARSWNAHSGRPLPAAVEQDLLSRVHEQAHAVATPPPTVLGRYFVNGFVGDCEYGLGGNASIEARRALNLLTRYAFFCGVGLKRTMGMGQVIGEPI